MLHCRTCWRSLLRMAERFEQLAAAAVMAAAVMAAAVMRWCAARSVLARRKRSDLEHQTFKKWN